MRLLCCKICWLRSTESGSVSNVLHKQQYWSAVSQFWLWYIRSTVIVKLPTELFMFHLICSLTLQVLRPMQCKKQYYYNCTATIVVHVNCYSTETAIVLVRIAVVLRFYCLKHCVGIWILPACRSTLTSSGTIVSVLFHKIDWYSKSCIGKFYLLYNR